MTHLLKCTNMLNKINELKIDVLVVGTGIAGLYTALNLDPSLNVLLVTKSEIKKSNSYLAQGGISVAKDKKDIPTYIEDTLKAGHYKNNRKAVEILAKSSREHIPILQRFGVPFDYKNNELDYTKEAAHRVARIIHCKDHTGKSVIETLIQKVQTRKNITVYPNTLLLDLIAKENCCHGAVLITEEGKQINVFSKFVVLATGGIGGLFKNTTNQSHITADGILLALKHGVALKDLNYIQFHPTAFYEKNRNGQRFLISESVRGEGGKLKNIQGNTFVNELLPRDILTKKILIELEKTNAPYVLLDISHLQPEYIVKRFPAIYKYCKDKKLDILKSPIPVAPAQHYFMGGIEVNQYAKTSMNNLYAVGEVSCTGVHGQNRLASNSLLEGLVFSKRAAGHINRFIACQSIQWQPVPFLVNRVEEIRQEQFENIMTFMKRKAGEYRDELVNDRRMDSKCVAGGYSR